MLGTHLQVAAPDDAQRGQAAEAGQAGTLVPRERVAADGQVAEPALIVFG